MCWRKAPGEPRVTHTVWQTRTPASSMLSSYPAGLSGAAEKKTKERVGEALSGGNVWSRAMESIAIYHEAASSDEAEIEISHQHDQLDDVDQKHVLPELDPQGRKD
ncbi:uncharacterized protein [Desmodus rotundus]|uniref:uncharacterized protein n=1 Tax=Desmodus rotundus TaxID=9430 RepID=UPI0039E53291